MAHLSNTHMGRFLNIIQSQYNPYSSYWNESISQERYPKYFGINILNGLTMPNVMINDWINTASPILHMLENYVYKAQDFQVERLTSAGGMLSSTIHDVPMDIFSEIGTLSFSLSACMSLKSSMRG